MTAGTGAPPTVREELWGPQRRAVTVGIVLLISLVAFEAMGVGTAMPALVADLGSVETYAWPFVAFIAAMVVGTVVAGRWCDRAGPRVPLVLGPLVFGVGLVVAGTAPEMALLLGGRLLQGLGAGALGVSVYVLIARVYPSPARPAVFALLSAAWVLPSLVGPPVAGLVTDRWSWHWVFLGLLPLVVLAAVLVAPMAARQQPPESPAPRRPGLVPAALASACGISALTWAGEDPRGVRLLVAAAGAGALVVFVRRLLPPGTPRARPGIAAVVAGRWLMSGAFFTAVAYLPLSLTDTHGWSLTAAGMPLVAGSLAWSGASAWQGRRPELSRSVLLRVAFALLAAGLAGLLLVVPAWGVPWAALPAMTLAGLGMGLGFSSLSYLLLQESPPEDVGFNSSSTQLSDQLSQACFVALGGILLALLVTPTALTALVVVLVGLACLGWVLSPRTHSPH